VLSDTLKLGSGVARHIGARQGIDPGAAGNRVSVLAPIAHRQRAADDPAMRGLRIAAWCTAATTTGLVVVAALRLAGVIRGHGEEITPVVWVAAPFVAVAVLTPTAIGLAIVLRRPKNVVGWILLLGAASVIGPLTGEALGNGWTLQVSRATWPLLYAWPIAVAYVFPNGRLLGRRWRWAATAAVACYALFMAVAVFDPSPFDPPDDSVRNPLLHNRFGEAVNDTGVWIPLWLGILASLFGGAAAIRLRLKRSTGIERLQTLWLAWAAALIPLGLVLCAAQWLVLQHFFDVVLFPFLLLMQATVAVAVGVAVSRHRLYAIERLINRTLVYALLTLLLAGAYAAVTLLLGVLAGRGSDWVVAGATLAVAAVFRPLRAGVQSAVDRRFARERFQGVRRVQAFEHEVREGVRAPEEIGDVLAEALRDPLATLLFWTPESRSYANAAGELVADLPEDGRAHTEIRREGARTALLLHDPALVERRALLDGVVSAATLSIEIARLRVEVRLQLAEVHASRARIVDAGYEERRRLERDLHDGAQQRLVSLGLRLRRLQRSLPGEAKILAPALDQVVAEVGSAISDLRQIAAGVRPARLDDGLAAALHDLAHSAPLPVRVEAPIERVSASIEAAAYFVACEALTNAVKHAAASRVSICARRENGTLLFSIADDGVGGAIDRRGSGLAGLRDRVAAHGGTLRIHSPRGAGTRIEVALPCES
jgi:signal transduction histidine kinase